MQRDPFCNPSVIDMDYAISVVLARMAEPGMVVGSASESVGGGEALFEVADPTQLVAACIVKEYDALEIAIGRKVNVLVAGDKSAVFGSKISRVSPIISNDSGLARRKFYVTLEKSDKFLPGMNAVVEILQ